MSRLRDRLLEVIEDLRDEIDDEWEAELRETESLDEGETGHSVMEGVRRGLRELIQGRSLWFDHEDGIAWHDTSGWFQDNWLETHEEDVQMILSEQFVSHLDGVTDRVVALPTIRLRRVPSEQVRGALNHATRCYLYGLMEPSAALCRATLEAALADSLPQNHRYGMTLEDMIDRAHILRLLTYAQRTSAHRIRQIGNDAAHGRSVGASRIGRALQDLKTILEKLYRT